MKKRYIVLGALVLGLALIALGLGAARRGVVGDDRRDFAAETFRGAAETRYVQLSLYPKEEKHLTADGMMAVKNALEASLTADGIKPDGGYLLAGSGETAVTLTRESVMADGMTSVNTTDATATVYFGNWFGLHPTAPLTGGFVNGGETGYGYIKRASNVGPAYPIQQFVEKPDLATATRYVESKEYFWNSGMFMFSAAKVLDELRSLAPAIYEACAHAFTAAKRSSSRTTLR